MEFRRVLFRSLFYWLARLVERRPALRRVKPGAVVRTFEETVRVEMDLRVEASAASELAGNFAGDPDFRVPAIDWRRTARRVLTLERIDGIRIDDVPALKAEGFDPGILLERCARAFFNQAFRDGFFHRSEEHTSELQSLMRISYAVFCLKKKKKQPLKYTKTTYTAINSI